MSEWNVASDVKPQMLNDECSITVLCFLDREWMVSGYFDVLDDEWYDPEGEIIDGVMQWRLLPEGPQ